MIGYFENGKLYIDIEVFGIVEEFKKKFKARVDTGFDGYLSIPLIESFSLGLILKGTQTYTIADGSTKHNLVCLGNITCGDKGVVIVPIDVASGPILVGVKLLKELKIKMHVDYLNEEVIFDNSPIKEIKAQIPIISPFPSKSLSKPVKNKK